MPDTWRNGENYLIKLVSFGFDTLFLIYLILENASYLLASLNGLHMCSCGFVICRELAPGKVVEC